MHEEQENKSDGELIVPKLPPEVIEDNEHGPPDIQIEGKAWKRQKYHQAEGPMDPDPTRTVKDDRENSAVGGVSNLDFIFLDEGDGVEQWKEEKNHRMTNSPHWNLPRFSWI